MSRLIIPIEVLDPNQYHITKVRWRVSSLDTLARGFRRIGAKHKTTSFTTGKTFTATDTCNDYFIGKNRHMSRQAKHLLVLDPDTQHEYEGIEDEIQQLNKQVSELQAKQGKLIRRNKKKYDQLTDEWAEMIIADKEASE